MIVFGSRRSDLALGQTRMCAEQLRAATGVEYSIVEIETTGDRVVDRPLEAIGVKGAFTVELEEALRSGRVDAAVHSLKDLPVEPPAGLLIGAIPARAAAEDVLVFDPAASAGVGAEQGVPLHEGCRVGTSSPRRRAALQILRPDLELADIRGNVPTRADKVRRGDYRATVLAAAGLDRLGLDLGGLQRWPLPVGACPPAPGQGALAVQCRAGDEATQALLSAIHDPVTAECVGAERRLLGALGGGCSLPLGVLVTREGDGYCLQASLFGGPGPAVVRAERRGGDVGVLVDELAARWRPLMGERLGGLRLAMIRPDGEAGELAAALEVAGAVVDVLAWTRTEELAADFAAVGSAGGSGRALAFSSARAVARFASQARRAGVDVASLGPCFAAGPATASALRALGLQPHETPAEHAGGAGLAELVRQHLPPREPVVFPCAEERHVVFERRLAEQGREVLPLPLYRTVADPGAPGLGGPCDAILFTSPSAVTAFGACNVAFDGARIALGETTAAALEAAGLPAQRVAARPEAAAVIDVLQEFTHVGET